MASSLQLAATVAAALSLPRETLVQHLRNLQRKPSEMITYTGRGRGAARMTSRDAARLLLAAAGSDLVKDSVDAAKGFGGLVPIGFAGGGPRVTLEDRIAADLTLLASDTYALDGDARFRIGRQFALTLMSAPSADLPPFPRAAILRAARDEDRVTAVTFAGPSWTRPILSELQYASDPAMGGAGLLRVRHVTLDAFRSVAASL